MFKTCSEAMNWVMQQKNWGCGFEKFCELMRRLGNPQDQFKTIHVAGTNGKGSTVQFIQSLLKLKGLKVGTFTSPHLISHLDRIRYDGEWISEEDFLRIINEYYDVIQEYKLGMFEIDTLIMTVFFKEKAVDFAIVEAGIGGRRDSTNCINSSVISVITSIGKDHCNILGDTLEEIAFEKAGIIKQDSICVVGDIPLSSMQVINKVGDEKNTQVICARQLPESIVLSSEALYQRKNASVALEVIEQLQEMNLISISKEEKFAAFSKSFWPGRYEIVNQNPKVILDGAHNAHGIKALAESLSREGKPVIIIFSVLADKSVKEMINQLLEVASKIIVTEFDFYRALPLMDYPEIEQVEKVNSFQEAYDKAVEMIGDDGTICVCGSLYFISEVRKILKR